MSIYKFKKEEIFVNNLKLYPKYEFVMHSGTVYINNEQADSGSFTGTSLNVPSGYISLHEINNDKLSGSNNFIYPFITKDGSLQSFATVSTKAFNQSFSFGDILTGSYPMSSSLYRNYYANSASRKHVDALRNTLNHYKTLSRHHEYSGTLGNKGVQELNLISVPSIFYGSRMKKGSVDLKFYITGTLIGHLQDVNRNGELIQVAPVGSTGSGSCAGVVLYNEGFLVLTGSWDLHATQKNYINDISLLKRSKWVHWGSGITGFTNAALEDVYNSIEFQGETIVPTMTMYAHAPKGELNHSNNPTFLKTGESLHPTGSTTSGSMYVESSRAKIKNTVYSPYDNNEETFQKHTYISKVVIYDEDMNILGVAKVAKPVKKTEQREFSFKLKIDI